MVEPAHVLIVQATSIWAFADSVIALGLIWWSLREFSPGIIKTAVAYLLAQTAIFAAALLFMLAYHVFDIDLAQDLWHIGALAGLVMGVVVTIQLVKIQRGFLIKR